MTINIKVILIIIVCLLPSLILVWHTILNNQAFKPAYIVIEMLIDVFRQGTHNNNLDINIYFWMCYVIIDCTIKT